LGGTSRNAKAPQFSNFGLDWRVNGGVKQNPLQCFLGNPGPQNQADPQFNFIKVQEETHEGEKKRTPIGG